MARKNLASGYERHSYMNTGTNGKMGLERNRLGNRLPGSVAVVVDRVACVPLAIRCRAGRGFAYRARRAPIGGRCITIGVRSAPNQKPGACNCQDKMFHHNYAPFA